MTPHKGIHYGQIKLLTAEMMMFNKYLNKNEPNVQCLYIASRKDLILIY